MYIAGFVIPVPEEKMEAYRKWAENGAAIFREYGCIEIVDSWEDNVPGGKYTDFRRAVDAKDDVFAPIRRRTRAQNRRLDVAHVERGNFCCRHCHEFPRSCAYRRCANLDGDCWNQGPKCFCNVTARPVRRELSLAKFNKFHEHR